MSTRARLLLLLSASLRMAAAGPESEAREILERRCLGCHGPKAKISGLDLSTRAAALSGGTKGPALQPGAASESLLLARVEKGQMPPSGPLPDAEKQALRRWIESGAAWGEPFAEHRAGKDWWSLQPLKRTSGASSIDEWISAGLAAKGLSFSAEADRRTLIRRLNFDLLGLPPKPEEIDAFINDTRPDAYERLVDRLISSPHYGERWARHWLDVVRFAESEGFERDLLRGEAWRYRDYVIRSFNSDKPYPQFAREQIAGDVLQPVTREGIIATAFLVFGPVDAVGLTSAVEAERELVRQDYLEEMVGVVGQTFLGLTVNCARCHDHKFDPIPQKDFYRLKAVFESVWPPTKGEEFFPNGNALLTPEEANKREERTGPVRARIAELENELAALYRSAIPIEPPNALPRPFAKWTFDTDSRDEIGILHAELTGDAELAGGRLRPAKGKDTVTLTTPAIPKNIREKTLEAWVWIDTVPDKALTVFDIKNRTGYRGASMDGIQFAAGEKKQWQNASTASFRTMDVDGPKEASAASLVQMAIVYSADNSIQLFRNGKPYGKRYKPQSDLAAGSLQTFLQRDAVVRLSVAPGMELDEARLYDSALSAGQIEALFSAGAPSHTPGQLAQQMTAAQRDRLATLKREIEQRKADLKRLAEPEKVHSAQIAGLRPTYLQIRGDVTRKGEQMSPGAISCLQGRNEDLGLDPNSSDGERRRKLAEWIASAENPLFARVMVNRMWLQHFGRGLIDSPNDFGYNGGKPSHPELLDWLAAEFIRGGWSMKNLHKMMVMSRAYRQASAFRADAAAMDSDNRLLWRFAPQRLQGEQVRDAMLAASGKLTETIGGPSFQPFEAHAAGSYQNWKQIDSDVPDFQRRTIYRMNVTSAGNPMLESLDCPLPSVKTPKRPSTTTALQALSLMNNDFANRIGKAFAQRVAREASSPDTQIERAFRLALGRAPGADELRLSRGLVERQGLETLCWGLFNTSEFLYVD